MLYWPNRGAVRALCAAGVVIVLVISHRDTLRDFWTWTVDEQGWLQLLLVAFVGFIAVGSSLAASADRGNRDD